LADATTRKGVIAVCLAIWSGMTALCGTASGFAMLLVYRVGVGIGEAGGSPPAHSLISDYFPPERRATALGIFSLGVPIGILIGFLAGGWLDETLGWRMAFVVVGMPGLLLGLLVVFTLKEPPRGHSEGHVGNGDVSSAVDVIRFLWRSRAFRHISFASGLYTFVGYSTVNWAPSFLIRSHGMASIEVGSWLALIYGIGGGLGTVGGGILADRWARSDPRGRAFVPAIAMLAALPFSVLVFMTDSATVALAALGAPAMLGLMYQAPAFAITQSLATPAMRATAAAVLLFVINIIGLALGPLTTGVLSDVLEPRFGDDSLRYALLIVSCVLPWSGVHFWLGARTLEADVAYVRQASENS
jgi:MFS family permease